MVSLRECVSSTSLKNIHNNDFIILLRKHSLNEDQYKLYAAQRACIASKFTLLLKKCIKLADEIGDYELENALEKNLQDELGINNFGVEDPTLNHKNWKDNYLNALGINANIDLLPLLGATKRHVLAMSHLEASGDVYTLAGALLYMENIIPLEYRSAIISRDYLFPDEFMINPDDDNDTVKFKIKNRNYMNDHVIHDTKKHFPDLLNALGKYEENKTAMNCIKAGIELINSRRIDFYNNLSISINLDRKMMYFYTYAK